MRFASTKQHLPRPTEWKKQVAYQRTPPAQAGEKQRTPPFLLLGHKFVVVDFLNFWLFISGKPWLSFSFVLSFFLTHVRQVAHQHTHTNTPVDGDVLWKISPKKWKRRKTCRTVRKQPKGRGSLVPLWWCALRREKYHVLTHKFLVCLYWSD